MKVSVNEQPHFEISEIARKVICYDIPHDIFEEDMKRRLAWIIQYKYEECFKRLKAEWEPRLIASGATSLPVDKDEFAALVFAHPEYKCRLTREQ